MDITQKLFKIFLALQGVIFLLLAYHNSVHPIGNLLPYSVMFLLFTSPILVVASVLQLFSKTEGQSSSQKITMKIAAVVGVLAGLLGLSMIVGLYLVYNSFIQSF